MQLRRIVGLKTPTEVSHLRGVGGCCLAERGRHFCTMLYGTGLVGTRPQINEADCTRCGICVETCPLPNVIDLKTLQVNYKTCQRCLLCYEACPENAISVKGYSGVRGLS